jgi:hypothetical protein
LRNAFNSNSAPTQYSTSWPGKYRLKRHEAGAVDRRAKSSLIDCLGLAPAVAHWRERTLEALPVDRAPSGEALWSYLVEEHD